MSVAKLTQAEAQRLLEMIKRSLITEIEFPTSGKSVEFGVRGDTKKDTFSVNIYRGKIQPLKYNIGARIKKKWNNAFRATYQCDFCSPQSQWRKNMW